MNISSNRENMACPVECFHQSKDYLGDFGRKLNALRCSGWLCDVVLIAEGVNFPAHRCVLAAGSDYFQVMFNINMAEKTKSRIQLPGATAKVLERILDFLYTGNLCIPKDSVVDAIFLASLLMLFDVVEFCWKIFVDMLDPQNCIERKIFADAVSSEIISKRATDFILKNFTQLDQNCIANCPGRIFGEILSSEDLSVASELDVFLAFLAWCSQNHLENETLAESLLGFVRFEFVFLTQESLADLLKSYGIFQDSVIYGLILERAAMKCGLPQARVSYRDEQVIVVVGGHGENSLSDKVNAYVPSCDKWFQLSAINSSRRSCGLVAIDQDLFVVGGTMERVLNRPIPLVERYDVHNDTWEDSHVTSSQELERDQAGVVGFHGKIVLTGGVEVGSGALMSSVVELSPVDGSWRRLESLCVAREGHAAVSHGNSIYVIGGRDQSGALDSVERYDTETETWCVLSSMNSRRYHACAVWFSGKLYVFGGSDGQMVLSSAEVYHPEDDCWQPLPDMLIPRMKFGVSVFNDFAYVVGGMKGSRGPMVADVEKYNFLNSSWSFVEPMKGSKMEITCATINVPVKFLK